MTLKWIMFEKFKIRGVPEVFTIFFIRFLHSIEHVPLKTAIWKITGSISQILLKGNEVMNVRNAVGKTKYEIIQKIHLKQKVVFRETSFDEIWFSLISLILWMNL